MLTRPDVKNGTGLALSMFALLVAGCGDNSDNSNLQPDGSTTVDMGGGGKPDLAGGADLSDPTPIDPEKATLRVHYPKGSHSLAIRGDKAGLTWDKGVVAAEKSSELFELEVTIPGGETLEWKPLLDDKDWSHGPNYKTKGGQTVDIYPHFYTSSGRLDKPDDLQDFPGDNLAPRDVWVYLPPSYDENPTAKYPVLYMHDGTNLFDANMAFGGTEWRVDETLDGAIEGDGSIAEMIVVGVFATNDRMTDYTPTFDSTEGFGGNGDAYVTMLVDKLKPTIDGKYRTLTGRESTGIMGSSLGGLISIYAGIRHPEVFGLVGAMSPSTWWDGGYIVQQVAAIDMNKVHPLRVYVDSGNPGDDYGNTKDLAMTWQGLGYQEGKDFHYVVEKNGKHSESYWAGRLPGALNFLFGARTP